MISKLSFYRIDLTIMGTQYIPSNSDLPTITFSMFSIWIKLILN